MKRAVGLPVLLLAAALAAACSDDVQDIYSSYPAFFRFSPVTAASQLYTAVSNPGQFCTVTFQNGQYYIFTDARGTSTSWSVTAQQQYGQPVYISGFIVGTPAVIDMSGQFPLTAYDLVCPHYHAPRGLRRRDADDLPPLRQLLRPQQRRHARERPRHAHALPLPRGVQPRHANAHHTKLSPLIPHRPGRYPNRPGRIVSGRHDGTVMGWGDVDAGLCPERVRRDESRL